MADAAATRAPGTPGIALETGLGEDSRAMRLAVVNDDMPFLVDSIAATIAAHDIAIRRIIHPVVAVERAGDGTLGWHRAAVVRANRWSISSWSAPMRATAPA